MIAAREKENGFTTEVHKRTFLNDLSMVCIMSLVMVIQSYTCAKTYWVIP